MEKPLKPASAVEYAEDFSRLWGAGPRNKGDPVSLGHCHSGWTMFPFECRSVEELTMSLPTTMGNDPYRASTDAFTLYAIH